MTRRDIITCFHEPFGDAFYFGPEKISRAWLRWPTEKIEKSGKSHYSYDYVLSDILDATNVCWPSIPTAIRNSQYNLLQDSTKHVLLKDMAYHIIPPTHSPNPTTPSLSHRFTSDELTNPSLFPTSILLNFRFVFLIRNPSASIPSLYRCFLPPLSELTGEEYLDPDELGYRETRLLFDYLYPVHSRSPSFPFDATLGSDAPVLIDADDLLSHPESIVRSVCTHLDITFSTSMLSWSSVDDQSHAHELFSKYAGYHEDALKSAGLRGKTADREKWGEKAKTKKEENEEWEARYGHDAATNIREAVDLCRDDFEYLWKFRIKPDVNEHES